MKVTERLNKKRPAFYRYCVGESVSYALKKKKEKIYTTSSNESKRESRRAFIKYGAAAAGGLAIGLAGGYGLSQSMAPPVTPPLTVTQTLSSASTGVATGEPINLAIVLDQHGPQGARGIQTAQFAVNDINQAGGVVINGQRRMFKLSVEDSKEEQSNVTPSDVITAGTKAVVDDHANALFGGEYSGSGLLPDVAAQYKCIYICGSGGNMDHSKITPTNKYKYVFEDQVDVIGWGTAHAHMTVYYAQKYNTKKIAWLCEDQLGIRKHFDVLQKYLPQYGIELDPVMWFPPTRTGSFAPELSKIRDAGNPLSFIQFWTVSSLPLVEDWKDTKLKTLFIGVDVNAMLPDVGTKTHGLYDYFINCHGMGRAPITDMTLPFFDEYNKTVGGDPSMNDANLYAGIYMYKAAIEKAQTLDSDVIADTIHNGTWPSPLGTIKFNDENYVDMGNIEAGLGFILLYLQWQNQQQYIVWPEKFAERKTAYPDWDMPPNP